MPVLKNISTLYTCIDDGGQAEIHPIKNGVIVWIGETIEWVGRESELPEKYQSEKSFDAGGKMVIPGLVDCHTHLCFGGWRADEFEMRIQGRSYLDIAKAGGGILSTVKATREASEDELYEKAAGLLKEIQKQGVTAIECKSGYGLSLEDELKQLRVYKRLSEETVVHMVSTFLGAHTIPPEFKENRKGYIDLVINKMIPAVAQENLAEFCDIFVEESAFTIDEARTIFEAGKKHGLTPKLHADQLSSGGGAELAAEVGAASADHLEQISDEGIKQMAEKHVVGVTLPLASLYTQQPYLNCRNLVDSGVEVAVATDFNPGSAPTFDLPLAMMLTCNHGRLTPAEVLKGATIYASKAINRGEQFGSIETGKSADFLVIDADNVNEWMYHYKGSRMEFGFLKGKQIN
ncbi:imidazolonepropionase [Rhodohalobacter barkolensis]|uniref:Imidazolonepropionase n=1 Tax=Rhodohalobacter barkolensis TaxID=2053187 RepID=A0A2N0VEI5_9BACT|nr:imidazolonepropionase [Rhodohalobacter barkolensis]PKD42597.1 imidazolonepropionase [Rhodohalobacter barkolensis]